MKTRGSLFIVSAPSGAGKTTILKAILAQLPAIAFSVSHTSRPPRAGEQEGKDYFFVSPEQFQALKNNNSFLEWAEVHGNFYGTSKQAVERELQAGRDLILDIDVQGARQVMAAALPACSIFIAAPSLTELEARLTNRKTESPASLRLRMDNARKEMAAADHYDYLVINDVLAEAIQTVTAIIIAQRAAAGRTMSGRPIDYAALRAKT